VKAKWLLPLIGLLIVIAATQLPRLLQMAPATPGIGGAFTLVDQQGRTVHDGDFRGKLMLIYFGYTFCPDICPTTLTQVAQVYGGLTPEQQAQVAPIFITVDPERDTVAQMAEYVPSFSPALIGLTGSKEQVAAALKAYHVYARKAGSGDNYGVDHSSILYLMGKDGRFLRHFDANAKNDDIKAAIAKALEHPEIRQN
jgi:cytochrome oxidase Cu insertion factor (SCO1/SenC/PrrC family)